MANEDHTHHATEEEISVYRGNWWIRSNFVGSDTKPMRHRSKKRCQPCVASRMQRIKIFTKIGGKALPHLGGNGKIPGGIPHLRHHRDDGLNTDGAGEPAKTVYGLFTCGMSLKTNFGAKVTVINSVTANAVYCHQRGCKEYTSKYRKLATETIQIQHEERQEH